MNVRPSASRADDETEVAARACARIGAIAWPSFFAAGVATIVFFAIVDPMELADDHLAARWRSRASSATRIGFFMFWACTFGSSAFTALLLSRTRQAGVRDRKQPTADR